MGLNSSFPLLSQPVTAHSPRTHLSELMCHSHITVRERGQAWSPVSLDTEICSKMRDTHFFFPFFFVGLEAGAGPDLFVAVHLDVSGDGPWTPVSPSAYHTPPQNMPSWPHHFSSSPESTLS